MTRTYIYLKPHDRILFYREQIKEYIDESNPIAIYSGQLFLDNYNIGGSYFHGCCIYTFDNNRYLFVIPYFIDDDPETETENRNNAVCPVCGKVDYESWEWPSGQKYICGLCGSQFILYHKYITEYDGDMEMHTKLVLEKINKPKRLRKDRVCLC